MTKKLTNLNEDYDKFKRLELKKKLFKDGMHNENRHPMSKRIGKFLSIIDYKDFQDSLCWSFGGDGDNGEVLLDELDAFFYTIESNKE